MTTIFGGCCFCRRCWPRIVHVRLGTVLIVIVFLRI